MSLVTKNSTPREVDLFSPLVFEEPAWAWSLAHPHPVPSVMRWLLCVSPPTLLG